MEDTILNIQDSDNTIKTLRKLDTDVRTTFESYIQSAEDYLDYLGRSNSEESKSEETKFNEAFIKAKQIVEKSLEKILKTFRMNLVESAPYLSSASSERRKHTLDL